MVIKSFEELKAWQKAQDFAVKIYGIFGVHKDFGFKDQILRAVLSISNNVAEGFDRSSNADFSRFLYIASGSCSEVRSMLHLAARLKYISDNEKTELIAEASEVSRIIGGLIKALKKNKNNP